jgi:hypothetical protein
MESTLQREKCGLLLPREVYILQPFLPITDTFATNTCPWKLFFSCIIQGPRSFAFVFSPVLHSLARLSFIFPN